MLSFLKSRAALPAWTILGIALVVTAVAWNAVRADVESHARERFDFRVKEIISGIEARMQAYEQVLKGGVALFAASGAVTREQWRTYASWLTIERNYPEILGIGFARVLSPAEKKAHIEQMRAEGFSDYTIWPEGERAEYTSIVYLEPFSGRNLRAFGYDMFSEPARRAAMERARDEGEAAISGKITLVQESEKDVQPGFLMYLPVYRSGAATSTLHLRRSALVGYVYSPFRVHDLMHGIAGRGVPDLDIEIHDGDEAAPSALMYDEDPEHGEPPLFEKTELIHIAGRGWTLHFSSEPSFESAIEAQKPLIVLAGGLSTALLLFALVSSLSSAKTRAVKLAQAMTSNLKDSEEANRLIVETAHSAFISINGDGVITRWNSQAERVFGWRAEEAIGQPLAKTIIPAKYREAHRRGLEKFLQSGEGPLLNRRLELSALRKDGIEFPIELTISPMRTKDGFVFNAFVSDVSERKQVEEEARRMTADLHESRQRLNLALSGSNLALFEWNIESGDVYLNEHWAQLMGSEPGETRTTFAALEALVHTEDRLGQRERIRDALKGNTPLYYAEHRVRTRSGEWKWIMSTGKVIERDANGRALKMIGTNRDISERRENEENLVRLNTQLERGMDDLRQRNYEIALHAELTNFLQSSYTSKEAYMAIVMTARRLFPNISGALYIRHESHSHVERMLGWGDSQPESRLFSSDACWAFRRGKPHRVDDSRQGYLCTHFEGAARSTLCVPMIAQHELFGIICLSADAAVNEREQESGITLAEHASIGLANVKLREALRHQSNHDPLTGLLNRRYLDDALPLELVRAKRSGLPVSAIMVDIDSFKHYNDAYGHASGDIVLQGVARFLRGQSRDGDLVCRYGGEEFLLIMPATSLAGGREHADRLHEGVHKLEFANGDQPLPKVTFSMGVAASPEHGMDARELIGAADRALYKAKNAGRDRVITATTLEGAEPPNLKRIV